MPFPSPLYGAAPESPESLSEILVPLQDRVAMKAWTGRAQTGTGPRTEALAASPAQGPVLCGH